MVRLSGTTHTVRRIPFPYRKLIIKGERRACVQAAIEYENYLEVRFLTDSGIVVDLVESFYTDDIEKLFRKRVRHLALVEGDRWNRNEWSRHGLKLIKSPRLTGEERYNFSTT